MKLACPRWERTGKFVYEEYKNGKEIWEADAGDSASASRRFYVCHVPLPIPMDWLFNIDIAIVIPRTARTFL